MLYNKIEEWIKDYDEKFDNDINIVNKYKDWNIKIEVIKAKVVNSIKRIYINNKKYEIIIAFAGIIGYILNEVVIYINKKAYRKDKIDMLYNILGENTDEILKIILDDIEKLRTIKLIGNI